MEEFENMKKTKIVCTMGPNTNDKNIMLELAKNGMDVARFNFSHGDYAEHQSRLEILKEVRKELDRPVAALLDTKGPEIRTGVLKDGKKVSLKEGQTSTMIIFKSDPKDVKMIMVDPKVVELSVYNGIPHLLIPVVTDPKKASGALNWAVAEMTDRYKKFAECNVRDLKGYNEKVDT